MDRSRLAIVIPALNEAVTIQGVLEQVSLYGIPVVVDDGSTDATASIAERSGARVVRHARNQGYDSALNSGFSLAAELGLEYVITMDADGQHNPAQLESFIAQLDGGCELVLGRRDRNQRVAETVFAWAASTLWGISDPLCGMKGYRMRLYRQAGAFDTCHSIGTELAIRSVIHGARHAEVAVLTRDRLDAPRFGRRLSANLRIFRAMGVLTVRYFLSYWYRRPA